MHQDRLDANQLGHSLAQQDHGAHGGHKVTMTQKFVFGGADPSSLPTTGDTHLQVVSMLGSPVEERHGHTGASPLKGCENDEGVEASVVQREAERAQATNPAEETEQGDLIFVYKYQF